MHVLHIIVINTSRLTFCISIILNIHVETQNSYCFVPNSNSNDILYRTCTEFTAYIFISVYIVYAKRKV